VSRLTAARRIAIGLIALLLVIAVVLGAFGVNLVRRAFPQTSGQITIPGLSSKVSVLRDDRGVPQIYADNPADLFRAEGFVHAQDRFFEMDLRRHVTAGRLSELVGSAGVKTDRVIRTMGWRRVAEAELPTLKPETRQYLQAYADGVNAYISRAGTLSRMSLEYSILGQKVPDYRVEKWTPVDSLAWLKAMAWDLIGDYDNELMRATIYGRVTDAQLNELFPSYPEQQNKPILSSADWSASSSRSGGSGASGGSSDSTTSNANSALPGRATGLTSDLTSGPTTGLTTGPAPSAVPSHASQPQEPGRALTAQLTSPTAKKAYASAAGALAAIPALLGRGDGVGSNSWVVGPGKSTTGHALLANDPHLGPRIPGIWYQVGLHCRSVSAACPFDVSGFSFSGAPGVIIGHNNRIAWGFTNLNPDVSDLYLQQVRGGTYLRDGKYVPLESRQETIQVAGEADQTFTVQTTAQGPIISDAIADASRAAANAPVGLRADSGANAVSLAWTGLKVTQTADAIMGFDTAQNFKAFRAAAKQFAVPSQNLLYADVDGHIGYQAPGQIPIRKSSAPGAPPGFWPAPGWLSAYDWKGYVSFSEMPYTYDPPEGFLVAANQAVTGSDSGGPFLTTEWDYGYRAQRIRYLLQAQPKVSPQRMSQIQGDTRNDFAPVLVKRLLRIDLSKDPFTQDAQQLLRGWDFTNPVGNSRQGAAAAYYNAVWRNLLHLAFDDELPPSMLANGGDEWMRIVSTLLTDGKARDAWWDNKQTPGVIEGRDEILRQAMVEARNELTRTLGKDPKGWQWGKLHRLELTHEVLGGDDVPLYIRPLFNRGPYEMPGGSAIIDANGWTASEGYGVDHAPSMRMVVDLGNLDGSTWVNQTGESGHAFNAHYNDQTKAWIKNEPYPWPFTDKAIRDSTADELTLVPETNAPG
jgi:penicillin amidase